ncbi:MAG: hypothetical protein JXB38_05185 [Anaerolineales bacterium]|nr:hypothetical protein [Anaerolineales bacterium]
MKSTLHMLLNGNPRVLVYYENALEIWQEILADPGLRDLDALAREIEIKQTQFELECGGKPDALEIMALVGLAQFYNESGEFGEDVFDALTVVNAVLKSNCSPEVKEHIRVAAECYGLQGNNQLNDSR